jgi:P27 family predicted phage terminase small subunit
MGRRGTKPTPTAMLKLRGSWRADLNKNEPQPDVGLPEMPDFLEGNALACWDELAPMLVGLNVLTVADKHALALLCETYSSWRRAIEMLKKHGDVYPILDDNGKIKYLQQTPYVSMSKAYAKQLKDMLCEFGLTPSSRSRIQTVQDSQTNAADDKMKYLQG